MRLAPVGVGPARVALVSDGAYHDAVLDATAAAANRLLASVFIVDVNAHHDPDTKVAQVIRALADAQWRGADVRLLIGGSRTNLAIEEACWIARAWTQAIGVDCRMLAEVEGRGSHSKYVIADDVILTGSHNWSLSAIARDVQDSVLVRSSALASCFAATFEAQWTRAGIEP